jgi:hypothetical protein
MPGIEQDWLHLPNADHGKGLEVILQAHTLAGFPRTINALIKVHELGLHPEGTKHFDEHHNIDSWRKDGLNTLNAIYGPVSEKMRANFRKMHPLLESILVEHIYGRVLSRPLVGLRMRELCTLSIVAGQNLPLQLVQHCVFSDYVPYFSVSFSFYFHIQINPKVTCLLNFGSNLLHQGLPLLTICFSMLLRRCRISAARSAPALLEMRFSSLPLRISFLSIFLWHSLYVFSLLYEIGLAK